MRKKKHFRKSNLAAALWSVLESQALLHRNCGGTGARSDSRGYTEWQVLDFGKLCNNCLKNRDFSSSNFKQKMLGQDIFNKRLNERITPAVGRLTRGLGVQAPPDSVGG